MIIETQLVYALRLWSCTWTAAEREGKKPLLQVRAQLRDVFGTLPELELTPGGFRANADWVLATGLSLDLTTEQLAALAMADASLPIPSYGAREDMEQLVIDFPAILKRWQEEAEATDLWEKLSPEKRAAIEKARAAGELV